MGTGASVPTARDSKADFGLTLRVLLGSPVALCVEPSVTQAHEVHPIWGRMSPWQREKDTGETTRWLLDFCSEAATILLLILYWPKHITWPSLLPAGWEEVRGPKQGGLVSILIVVGSASLAQSPCPMGRGAGAGDPCEPTWDSLGPAVWPQACCLASQGPDGLSIPVRLTHRSRHSPRPSPSQPRAISLRPINNTTKSGHCYRCFTDEESKARGRERCRAGL